jgi:HAD superfamily phosphatase (TIGR01668 family)
LRALGIEAALLDLDNTLVGWQRKDVSDDVLQWLRELKEQGIRLCLVSNTRFGKRLLALSNELEIPCVRRAWKPRKKGFQSAMEQLGVDASRTIMIGDQMFTDIYGANRLGIYTVMVRPLAKREFIGTKISRLIEKVLLLWFKNQGMLKEIDIL